MNKIKVLVFERDEERTVFMISVNGKILEQVNNVVYLGSMFSRDGRFEMDVEGRIAAGNKVNGALAALTRRRYVSTGARFAVHNAVLYGVKRCYTAAKRGYYRRRMKER